MRRLLSIALVLFLLGVPLAQAKSPFEVKTGWNPHYRITMGWDHGGVPYWLANAAGYWGVQATCPANTVNLIWDADLLNNTPYGRVFGMANVGACWNGGIFNGSGRTIWLNPSFTPSDKEWCIIVIHEYGHLIGLWHNELPVDIMSMYSLPSEMPGC